MTIVILVGCSTAGKSSAVRRFEAAFASRYKTVDTDFEVSREFSGDLYNLYLSLTTADDTTRAVRYHEQREREILRDLVVADSCLVAAGPLIPTREPEWSKLLTARRPICFYLRMTDLEIYDGLQRRRKKQRRSGLAEHPNFGCWDREITMTFDHETLRYTEIAKPEALTRLCHQMSELASRYEAACLRHRVYDALSVHHDRELQSHLNETFAYYLEQPDITYQLSQQFPKLSRILPPPREGFCQPGWMSNIDWSLST